MLKSQERLDRIFSGLYNEACPVGRLDLQDSHLSISLNSPTYSSLQPFSLKTFNHYIDILWGLGGLLPTPLRPLRLGRHFTDLPNSLAYV